MAEPEVEEPESLEDMIRRVLKEQRVRARQWGNAPTVKFMYLDHDTDQLLMAPPVQNTWYTVFDAYDVRLLWCQIFQTNGEAAAKDIEVRWTIDGNVYLTSTSLANASVNYIYRARDPSTGGTLGLTAQATETNASMYVDKRGQRFKVEVRITSALGTNQTLRCRCVRETLEVT